MIVGLMAIWAGMGTFSFGDYQVDGPDGEKVWMSGIFGQVRPAANDHRLAGSRWMVKLAAPGNGKDRCNGSSEPKALRRRYDQNRTSLTESIKGIRPYLL